MFEIEIRPDGSCDVRKDRRAFLYDCDDVEDAMARIRSREPHADLSEVTVIEPDGYKTTLKNYR